MKLKQTPICIRFNTKKCKNYDSADNTGNKKENSTQNLWSGELKNKENNRFT